MASAEKPDLAGGGLAGLGNLGDKNVLEETSAVCVNTEVWRQRA